MSSYKTKHQHHVCIVYCDQHVSLPTCKSNDVTWRYRDFFVTLRTFMNNHINISSLSSSYSPCSSFNPYTYWSFVPLRTPFMVTSYYYFSAYSHGYTIYETTKFINKPINFHKACIYLCI